MTQARADRVKVGDRLRTKEGTFRVAYIRETRWAKDAEGRTLLEFFAARNDRTGFLVAFRADPVSLS